MPGKAIGGMSGSGYTYSWSRSSSKVVLNISAMTLRAETLLSERGDIGEAVCGDWRASITLRPAAMAKSVDEDHVVNFRAGICDDGGVRCHGVMVGYVLGGAALPLFLFTE